MSSCLLKIHGKDKKPGTYKWEVGQISFKFTDFVHIKIVYMMKRWVFRKIKLSDFVIMGIKQENTRKHAYGYRMCR